MSLVSRFIKEIRTELQKESADRVQSVITIMDNYFETQTEVLEKYKKSAEELERFVNGEDVEPPVKEENEENTEPHVKEAEPEEPEEHVSENTELIKPEEISSMAMTLQDVRNTSDTNEALLEAMKLVLANALANTNTQLALTQTHHLQEVESEETKEEAEEVQKNKFIQVMAALKQGVVKIANGFSNTVKNLKKFKDSTEKWWSSYGDYLPLIITGGLVIIRLLQKGFNAATDWLSDKFSGFNLLRPIYDGVQALRKWWGMHFMTDAEYLKAFGQTKSGLSLKQIASVQMNTLGLPQAGNKGYVPNVSQRLETVDKYMQKTAGDAYNAGDVYDWFDNQTGKPTDVIQEDVKEVVPDKNNKAKETSFIGSSLKTKDIVKSKNATSVSSSLKSIDDRSVDENAETDLAQSDFGSSDLIPQTPNETTASTPNIVNQSNVNAHTTVNNVSIYNNDSSYT